MEGSSLAHTKWDCTYRIVWIPKYRRKVLYGQCRQEVGRLVRELLAKKPAHRDHRGQGVCRPRAPVRAGTAEVRSTGGHGAREGQKRADHT